MEILNIIYGLDPIFKQKAAVIEVVDDSVRRIADQMLKTMYINRAIGLGANMVGILKQIAVVDISSNNDSPYILINPKIVSHSEDTQVMQEASLSFPGISADITRPKNIKVEYLDYNGDIKILEAEDLLSSVIQHEIDYLNGTIFLDYLSKLKRDILIKKMQKYLAMHPPHIHSAHCSHH